MNDWISCSDRMPEPDTPVLVAIYGTDFHIVHEGETFADAIERDRQKVRTVTVGRFDKEEGWIGADLFPLMVHPSFWMPLPEPPEPPAIERAETPVKGLSPAEWREKNGMHEIMTSTADTTEAERFSDFFKGKSRTELFAAIRDVEEDDGI